MVTLREYHRLYVTALVVIIQCAFRLTDCYLTVNITSFEPDIPLQHAVVHRDTGDLYLGGTNKIYHLTSNLTLVAEQSSTTSDISDFCQSGGTMCVLPPGWDDNMNRVLLIDYTEGFLVACGSAFNGTCVLHHLDSINTVETRVHDLEHPEENSLGVGDSVVAFYGDTIVSEKVGSRITPRMDTGIFVAASFNPVFNGSDIRQHSISTKRLLQINNRWNFDLAFQELNFGRFTFIDMNEEYAHTYPVEYINGFAVEEFSYFSTVQKVDVDQEQYHSRIVRICNSDKGYYSYTEMPLKCTDATRSKHYNLLQAAHVGPVGSNLARELNMRTGQMALFGVFAESSASNPKKAGHNMALCIFTVRKISRKFRDGIQSCFDGYKTQGLRQFSLDTSCQYATPRTIDENFCGTAELHPIQAQSVYSSRDYLVGGGHGHRYTAISTFPVGADTIAVMGTNSGHIHKYVIEPLTLIPTYTRRNYALMPYKDIKLDSMGPVLRDMPFDLEKNHLYAMTPQKIYKVGIKTCEHYTHCSDCVTANDPNRCGWCGGVCTTREECEESLEGSGAMPDDVMDAENGPEWVTDACSPVINEVSPVFGPLQGGTEVVIIGDSLTTGSPHINSTLNVTIAGQPCGVIKNASNVTHIVCIAPPISESVQGPVVVQVEVDDPNLTFTIGGVASSEPRYVFSYVEPFVTNFHPTAGPIFGGTNLVISGAGLNAGNTQEVTVAGVPCHVHRVTSRKIHCKTSNTSTPVSGPVVVSLDGLELNAVLDFQYAANPYVTSFTPNRSYLSGDLTLKISGFNLHLGQSVYIEASAYTESGERVSVTENCMVPIMSDTNEITDPIRDTLSCPAPNLSETELVPTATQPVVTNLTVVFNKRILPPMTDDGQIQLPPWELLYYPDPIVNVFGGAAQIYTMDPNSNILTIYGKYLDLVGTQDLVTVLVGGEQCPIEELRSTFIRCEIPAAVKNQGDKMFEVQVIIGNSQEHNLGFLEVPPNVTTVSVPGIIIGILAALVLLLIIVFVGIRRHRKSKRELGTDIVDGTTITFNAVRDETTGEVLLQSGPLRSNSYLTNPGTSIIGAAPVLMQRPLLEQINNELAAEISDVLIHEENLGIGKVLGQGHFGCVYAGKMTQDGQDIRVAVKSLHHGSLQEVTSFLREGIMMKDFKHRNVLALIGVSISRDSNMPYVVLPFMQNGDILSYVRDPANELTARQLLQFCQQIAEGMQYLASLKFVHRDLAARNCMLDESLVVKVADFGLSRDIYERDYYSAKDKTAKLPVRWMALECLERNIYNTRTDVWSFGVVMWELLTRGVVPYPSVDNVDVLKYLHGGRRLSQPDHCPDHVYEVMLGCWSVSPIDRPSFSILVDKLDQILMAKPETPAEYEKSDVYVNVPGTSSSTLV